MSASNTAPQRISAAQNVATIATNAKAGQRVVSDGTPPSTDLFGNLNPAFFNGSLAPTRQQGEPAHNFSPGKTLLRQFAQN